MTDDDWNEIGALIRKAVKRQRPYAGYFDWPDKQQKELGVVVSLCEAMEKRKSRWLGSLRSRESGLDPPDCEAKDLSGQLVGVEVTELVDGHAIHRAKRGDPYAYAEWSLNRLVETLRARLAEKDEPSSIKGGPYANYIVVLHTDELDLPLSKFADALRGLSFGPFKLITHAYVLLSYDPREDACPYIQLPIVTA